MPHACYGTGTEPLRPLIDPDLEAVAVVNEELPSTPAAASIARRRVAEALASFGFPRATIDDARLIVSELTTNAAQHTGSPRLRLYVWRSDNVARVAVHDHSRELPVHVISNNAEEERGRGVRLINALSHRWGVDGAYVGKAVWAELGAELQ